MNLFGKKTPEAVQKERTSMILTEGEVIMHCTVNLFAKKGVTVALQEGQVTIDNPELKYLKINQCH